ncbi:MAG: hypothetical protein ACE5F1_06555, partial [Planctomycetota bacterium]
MRMSIAFPSILLSALLASIPLEAQAPGSTAEEKAGPTKPEQQIESALSLVPEDSILVLQVDGPGKLREA